MSRPNLVHPEQPALLRALLHIYQFAASLKLAVVLLVTSAVTYMWGTFVEARYGLSVAQFGVYQAWWFNLLIVLLGVNIFCAASIRYPWKRYQTGFVITHIGLLTLLVGTAFTRIYGIDAQILVWEHQASGWALQDDSMHVSLTVHRDSAASDDELRRMATDVEQDEHLQRLPPIEFRPGPFGWKDYDTQFGLASSAEDGSDPLWLRGFRFICGTLFQISRLPRTHAGDVLYDEDGVTLRVLDYYADSRRVNAPLINVAVSMPRTERMGSDGKLIKSRYRWRMEEISIHELRNASDEFPHGANTEKAVFPGGTVAFFMTDDPRRLDAFLKNKPEGELGEKGQVVLFIEGQPRRFRVDEKLDTGRFRIDDTSWQAEIADYWPAGQLGFNQERQRYRVSAPSGVEGTVNPAVEILLYKNKEAEEPDGRLVLFADQPNLSIHSHENRIYGDYWFDHKDKDFNQRMQHGIGNRIDILQVPSNDAAEGEQAAASDEADAKEKFQLYFRRWDKTSIADSGKLPSAGSPETALDAFAMADQLKFYVHEHIPAARPRAMTVPVEFEKGKTLGTRRPTAKFRLTVDGNTEEFWLEAYKGDPDFSPRSESLHRIVEGENRRVAVTLPIDAVDIGFRVRLRDFERRLDPGTSQPSHYSSTVDYLDRNIDRKITWAKLDAASMDGKNAEQIDFPLVLSHDQAFRADRAQVTADGNYVFWLSHRDNNIQRIKMGDDDARPETVVGGPHVPIQPIDFAIDGDRLFWAEYVATRSGTQTRIRRADLDGSNEKTLATFPGKPTGLALDTSREMVYWSFRRAGRREEDRTAGIGRADYDGQQQEDNLLERSYGAPSSLAVDPIGERLYWTEPDRGIIRTARLDGSDVRKVSLSGEQKPVSVAVDPAGKRLYWADLREAEDSSDVEKPTTSPHRHRLWSAGLDGDDAQVVAKVRIDKPHGLKIAGSGDRLIWTQEAVLKHNVWITMNAPVEYANPKNSQSYRLFQESFDGPYEPGTQEYDTFVPAGVDAGELYLSVLTVNYDPGRFVRNTGCLVVVLGIATMFYMRAYFFRRPSSHRQQRQREPQNTERASAGGGRERSHEKPAEVIDAEVMT